MKTGKKRGFAAAIGGFLGILVIWGGFQEELLRCGTARWYYEDGPGVWKGSSGEFRIPVRNVRKPALCVGGIYQHHGQCSDGRSGPFRLSV